MKIVSVIVISSLHIFSGSVFAADGGRNFSKLDAQST